MHRPAFLITIDTEGDDLWSRPRHVTTRNADSLERFQSICEEHQLRPTWLVNHEMAMSPVFRGFAKDILARGTAEIGMHLHAWDSPPLTPLTDDDLAHHPYLIEYPLPVMREKVHALTALLEDTFGQKMTSHRAGRWGFDGRYAELLVDEGYLVDCSVTPHVTWSSSRGAPSGTGGPDYRGFPTEPYWVDLTDISRQGESPLLEVPATVLPGWPPLLRPLAGRLRPRGLWLRPNGTNGAGLLRIVRRIQHGEASYAEFMLHSSEFMPGGSPTFPTDSSTESLYRDLSLLFDEVGQYFRGLTLTEFRGELAAARLAS